MKIPHIFLNMLPKALNFSKILISNTCFHALFFGYNARLKLFDKDKSVRY